MKCFTGHDDDVVSDLLKGARLVTIRKGVLLYERSDTVDALYIVRSGVVEVANIDDKPMGYTEQVRRPPPPVAWIGTVLTAAAGLGGHRYRVPAGGQRVPMPFGSLTRPALRMWKASPKRGGSDARHAACDAGR